MKNHIHNAELRSSAELLSELQKSEEGKPCLTKVEDWQPGDWCGTCYKSS